MRHQWPWLTCKQQYKGPYSIFSCCCCLVPRNSDKFLNLGDGKFFSIPQLWTRFTPLTIAKCSHKSNLKKPQFLTGKNNYMSSSNYLLSLPCIAISHPPHIARMRLSQVRTTLSGRWLKMVTKICNFVHTINFLPRLYQNPMGVALQVWYHHLVHLL